MYSLSSMGASPYDWKQQVTSNEATPDAVTQRASGNLNRDMGIRIFPFDGDNWAQHSGVYQSSATYKKNPDYYFGSISDMNTPVNIYRGENLGSTLVGRQQALSSTMNDMRQRFGEQDILSNFNPEQDYAGMNNRRASVYQALEEKFGPGFRTIPEAQAIIKDFEGVMSQSQDTEKLNAMVESGKRAEDYLSSNPLGTLLTDVNNLGSWGGHPNQIAGWGEISAGQTY